MLIQRRKVKRVGECDRGHTRRRDRETLGPLAPLFVFSPPPGPALCKLGYLGQPGELFVLPEVLTPVLGTSFVPFLRAFPFLVF